MRSRSGGVPAGSEVARDVARVEAGEHHSCALGSNGALRCWGLNARGQVGNGAGGGGTGHLCPHLVAGLGAVR